MDVSWTKFAQGPDVVSPPYAKSFPSTDAKPNPFAGEGFELTAKFVHIFSTVSNMNRSLNRVSPAEFCQ